jgi:DNA-binding FadR family transcriptional regulator
MTSEVARLSIPRRSTQKVSHLLAADLRRQILSGELPAGHQLPSELALIDQLRVSRDTLREALRILESQSLLEIRRGRNGGAVVREPGLDAVSRYVALLLQLRGTTLGDLEEARSVLEPPAAQLVAERAEAALTDRLVVLHEAERAAIDDPLAFVTAVAAFDQAVTELSGNRTLAVVTGVFRDIYAGHAYSASGDRGRAAAARFAKQVVKSHSSFLDAVRRGDASSAKQAWVDYLVTTSRLLVSRNQSGQPIDMTPLWRARAAQEGGDGSPLRALAVAGEIRARMAEGRLREGDRLPSLPELAAEFGISRPTLREALRILETEALLDLRTGDRGGATVRAPSVRVAAQLAGFVLEARQTVLADFHRALGLIEPAIVELISARIDRSTMRRLEEFSAKMAASVDDTARFVETWDDAATVIFSATQNPALTVAAEILASVRAAVMPLIADDVTGRPGIPKWNRRAQQRFGELIEAMAAGDCARARDIWAQLQGFSIRFAEDSELGGRLIVELLG